MSRNAATGIYTRVDNSFSNPVLGTTISPTDADTFFDDVEVAMNSFIGTSTSSLAIGTGTKTFTTQLTKTFLPGTFVQALSQANPTTDYMYGSVTSYNPATGALVLNVTAIGGSGTLADWGLVMAGAQGPVGLTGPGYAATSVSSQTIGSSGTKTFTTQSGLAYSAGARVRAADAGAPATNYMEGVVSSYSGTTLAFTADRSVGSGTLTSWTINIAGDRGAPGSGDMTSTNNLSDVSAKYTAYDNLSVHGADIASASTVNLETATGNLVDVTGTTTITAITLSEGHERTVRFTGILTLTNGASLVLPGATNITTAAGDYAVFRAYGAGVVRCIAFTKASGKSVIFPSLTDISARGQGKETIFVPAVSMTSRTTNGPSAGSVEMSTNKNMFKTLDFDTTTQEFAQFEVWFPKSWNLGTVTFQPMWSHAATTTNFGVAFGLAGVARSDNDAGDVAFGTAVTSVDTGGTTNNIYLGPESAAITIAGTPAAGDTVLFQINRTVADAGDTMAIDARLHGVRLFFTTNAATDA